MPTTEDRICIVAWCNEPTPYTWFCQRHYMAKELNYAWGDICAHIDGEDESGVRLDIAKNKVKSIMDLLWNEPKEHTMHPDVKLDNDIDALRINADY